MMYVTNQNEKNSTVYKAGITKYNNYMPRMFTVEALAARTFTISFRKLSLALLIR